VSSGFQAFWFYYVTDCIYYAKTVAYSEDVVNIMVPFSIFVIILLSQSLGNVLFSVAPTQLTLTVG